MVFFNYKFTYESAFPSSLTENVKYDVEAVQHFGYED